MKILIVEDSRADLAILGEYVRRFGSQGDLCSNRPRSHSRFW